MMARMLRPQKKKKLMQNHCVEIERAIERRAAMPTMIGGLTMMIVGILLAASVMVTALYGFGYFNTPYIGTFRIAFYFSLIFLVVTLVVAAMDSSDRGYDPTPQSRENAGR
jgi:uncharacterized membrane protein YtjA (UPF0391 family)